MVRQLSALVLLLLACAASVAAGQAADARQRPTRDRSASLRRAGGTASITGHIVAGDTGRALARARVTLTGADLPDGSLSTFTDQAGTYVLSELPAGSYSLTATKTSFVTMAYGAQRPLRPGRRIAVAQGQQVRDIDVRLPRGSVLTGRVYDDNGDPIVRATVQALRYQYLQGEPRLVAGGSAQTDDRGQFRIYGLTPGSYIVAAAARMESLPERGGRAEPAAMQSYAPTYYPGVTNPGDAAPVLLGLQQEYANVDLVLQVVPTARVSGTVVTEAGAIGGAMVVLAADDPRGVAAGSTYAARVQEDGSFSLAGVSPGRYLLVARVAGGGDRRGGVQAAAPRASLVGIVPVTVSGQDVVGLNVAVSAGGAVSGWITLDAGTAVRADTSQVRISTIPPTQVPFVGSETARVQADGGFTISNVVGGSHLLRVNNLPRGWALKGIYFGGRDVTDQAVDVKSGQTLGGVQVVLTDRVTALTGSLLNREEPLPDCYVVAFTTDSSQWRPRSRTIQGTRTDEQGAYRFDALPPGEYYVVAAPDIEPGAWYDPSLLQELSRSATRVALQEGETRSVALRYDQKN